MTTTAAQLLNEAANRAKAAGDPRTVDYLRARVEATRLKFGRGDIAVLSELPATDCLHLLMELAGYQSAPDESVTPLIHRVVTELRGRQHESVAALLLWSDESSGLAYLKESDEELRAGGLQRRINLGQPSASKILEWIQDLLELPTHRDDSLMALLVHGCQRNNSEHAIWPQVVDSIRTPWQRGRALLELAVRLPGPPDEALLQMAEATHRETVNAARSGAWAGYADTVLAGTIALSSPERCDGLTNRGWQSLYAVLDEAKRMQAYKTLLLAATQRGLGAWARSCQTLRRDLLLRSTIGHTPTLMQHAILLAPFVRGSRSTQAASLVPIGELMALIRSPEWRARLYGQLAAATGRLTLWPPLGLMDRLEEALKTTKDSALRRQFFPEISTLAARASPVWTRRKVTLCRTPWEEVTWLLALAESELPPPRSMD